MSLSLHVERVRWIIAEVRRAYRAWPLAWPSP